MKGLRVCFACIVRVHHNDHMVLIASSQPCDSASMLPLPSTSSSAASPAVQASGTVSLPFLRTRTNYAGGTLGGITNGEDIVFRVAIKPVSTIGVPQETACYDGAAAVLQAKGRHDSCVLPRATPLVEGMAALVLIDAALMQRSRNPACLKTVTDATPATVAVAVTDAAIPAARDTVGDVDGGALKRPRTEQ